MSFTMNFILRTASFLLVFLLSLKYQIVLGQNRIVGGDEIEIENVPYILRLKIGRTTGNLRSVCGASIIGKEWALTAAHCFDNPNTNYNNIHVVAGTDDIRNLGENAKEHKVTQVIKHHLYKGTAAETDIGADIAVLKVSPPFTYNQAIQQVKLPVKGQPLKINSATVSGWGDTWPGGSASSKLRYVTLPRINAASCKAKYHARGIKLKLGEICYGFNNGTVVQDKCQGDSGGPLVNSDKIQLGIASWGIYCGTEGIPGVYTDTVYFRDWIKTKTGI